MLLFAKERERETNKRPMGHIAHLRNLNTVEKSYDYIITLIRREKTHLLLKLTVPYL